MPAWLLYSKSFTSSSFAISTRVPGGAPLNRRAAVGRNCKGATEPKRTSSADQRRPRIAVTRRGGDFWMSGLGDLLYKAAVAAEARMRDRRVQRCCTRLRLRLSRTASTITCCMLRSRKLMLMLSTAPKTQRVVLLHKIVLYKIVLHKINIITINI